MVKNMKMNVEQVTDMAVEFLREKARHLWVKITKVTSDEKTHIWKVTADIGTTTSVYKTITIDDNNEKITGYE